VTKLEDFLQTIRRMKTSDLVSYLCTGHDMHNNSIIARVVDDAYRAGTRGTHSDALGNTIRKLSPAEENDVRAAIVAVATEVDRRIPAEDVTSKEMPT
jgi:hypothetical protein